MDNIVEKAKMFESEEISKLYILVRHLIEWQKETGWSLDDLAIYLEGHFEKAR